MIFSARVVLDTNVLISAALKTSGSEARVLDLVADPVLDCFVSEPILREYSPVLYRPKLERSQSEYLARVISTHANIVTPVDRLTASPDESDNRFLQCAETAQADFLATGNKRHFPQRWKTTAIVNARELLTRLNA